MQARGRSRPRLSGQRGSLRALAVYTIIALLAIGFGARAQNTAQSLSDPSAFTSIQDRAVRSRAIFGEMARVIQPTMHELPPGNGPAHARKR